MGHLRIHAIQIICCVLLTTGCSKDDDSKGPNVSDQETAELLAWAVKSSVSYLTPSSETTTWSGTSVSGFETGSAVITGSFTYDYDSYSGRKDETYTSVVIEFKNYSDDSYYPRLTGTVTINGTCTTQYGWDTSYWGQWQVEGVNLKLSGELSGTASINMIMKRGGLDWAAIVSSEEGTWNMSN